MQSQQWRKTDTERKTERKKEKRIERMKT